MRFYLFFFLLLPLCHNKLLAQQQSVQDSLLLVLKEAKGESRLTTLFALCENFSDSDREKATHYCKEALALAQEADDKKQSINYLKKLGSIKRTADEYDSALYFFEQTQALAIVDKDSTTQAWTYWQMGIMFERKGQLVNSMDAYLKALAIYEILSDSAGMGSVYNSMAFVYRAQKDNAKALSFFEKALAIRTKLGVKESISGTVNNIGLIYLNTKEFLKAREYFVQSASYLDTSIHKREFAMIYNNLGITYENVGEHQEAHRFYLKSLKIKQARNDRSGIASSYGNIGANLERAGKYDQAIPYSLLSYELAKEIGSLDMMITATVNLSRCYKKKGNYKLAVEQLDHLIVLEDSLFKKNKSEQIAEMMTKYEAEKKDKENELLKAKNVITEVQARNSFYGFATTALLSVLVITFAFMLWRRNERRTKVSNLLGDYTDKIEQANMQLEESVKEKNNLMNIVAHDLKSPLNKVMGLLTLVKLDGTLNENQKDYIDKMHNVLEQGRRLIADLLTVNGEQTNNLTFESVDLASLIENMKREYEAQLQEKQLHLHVTVPNEPLLFESVKDHMQRILDNLISNAIKFSPREKNIFVDCRIENKNVVLTVKDEGPGFTEDDKKNLFKKFQQLSAKPTGGEGSTGLGLTIVKQLCDQLKAKIELISMQGKGATFKVRIPSVQ